MPKEPTPSDRAPQQSAPFSMPSPFPAQAHTRRSRAKGATVWTIVGMVLASAVQYFLNSHGVPAPVVDDAARVIRDALPK
jgi:hypothetical protein